MRSAALIVAGVFASAIVPSSVVSAATGSSAGVRAAQRAGDTASASSALAEFQKAIDAYRKVHEEQEAKTGPLPKTADPAAITRRQHALGDAIRKARAGARQGDIFTPPVAALLKGIIREDLRQRRPVDRQAFIVSQPDTTVRVNEFYPTTVPLATVPPRLLAKLPRLPDGLQYRFVNGSLILLDLDPNLVVDVLPDAVPADPEKR